MKGHAWIEITIIMQFLYAMDNSYSFIWFIIIIKIMEKLILNNKLSLMTAISVLYM